MRTATLTFLTSLFALATYAQQPDPTLARITYHFTHVRDTNARDNPYTEKMLLVIGKNAAVYTSLAKIERDLDLPGAWPAPGAPFKPITQEDFYSFNNDHTFLTRRGFSGSFYLIEEEFPEIKWKIAKDTATFSGVNCIKATGQFKGRDWTAWFAPALPFHSGPWKLSGLPGLIIQAYDAKKEVMFEFGGIDNLSTEGLSMEMKDKAKKYEKSNFFATTISLPTDSKKVKRTEFDKVYTLYLKDPVGFIASQSGKPRSQIFMGSSATGVSHNIINNPIELPEVK